MKLSILNILQYLLNYIPLIVFCVITIQLRFSSNILVFKRREIESANTLFWRKLK